MTTQPEPLRLAEQLETEWGDDCELDKAAAELRRLYALNQEWERNRIAFEQALTRMQTAAIALAHKIKMYEDALGEIAWSNDSEWQQDLAKQVLAQMRGVEL